MPQKKKKTFSREPAKKFGYKKNFGGERKQKNDDFKEDSYISGDFLTGIYKQVQGNFGFIDTLENGVKKGYFVHDTQKKDALEGDEVAFLVKIFRGKDEAIVQKVLKRSENNIVGTLKVSNGFAFVIPQSEKINIDIYIPGKYIGGYTDGTQVAVQIVDWKKKNPEGRIIAALDSFPEGRREIYALALQHGARTQWSPDIKKELQTLVTQKPQENPERKNLREELTFTIDGAESKDLDDAISVKSFENGDVQLCVHIADVAEYVREGTHLDEEALKRGTSIYLCDIVIPMLPKEISNGTCSLHPGEEKLSLTCEMLINNKGHILKSSVYESTIISDFRLTYSEVQDMVDKKIKSGDILLFGGTLSAQLLTAIETLKKLRDTLGDYKKQKGMLDFDFSETKILLDIAGNPVEFNESHRYDSYRIIEHAMILANEAVAKVFHKNPFLYRVHEVPDSEDVEKFERILESQTGEKWSIEASPIGFQKVLDFLQNDERYHGLQRLFLRTLTKARYSEKNAGHFGLASDGYSHFTSPIRRYPDLQIHRIIKEILRNSKNTKELYLNPERKNHYKTILPEVALHTSRREEISEKLEYKVRDMMAAKWMKDKIGESFDAKISGMIAKGFFVELENTIEGFIDISKLNYQFDDKNFVMIHRETQDELHFGNKILVKLMSVDEKNFRIDFELVEVL